MGILINFILSFIIGFSSANITYFIDFCFNEGNILDFYYKFILNNVKPYSEKLFKLLGGCIICFGFWINISLFLLFFKLNYLPIELFFISLGSYSFKIFKLNNE